MRRSYPRSKLALAFGRALALCSCGEGTFQTPMYLKTSVLISLYVMPAISGRDIA